MPFFLDTQEIVERFEGPVAEFRSLLDRDHICHGSPNDLFAFTKTLEENNQLRLDLSTLVKSVVSRERGELLLTDMMSIIAAAVGGLSVADATADITKPTNALMEFLLGTGCWNWKHFGSTLRPTAQRMTEPPVRAEEPEPVRISHPVSQAKSEIEMPEDKASLLDISKELRQTLSRLESNTQQVKLHLDSIERRIGKLESTPNSRPEDKLAGLEPLLHRGASDAGVPKLASFPAREMPSIDPPLATRGRAVFAGTTLFDESAADDNDDDFTSPTFAYGTEKRSGLIPVIIFIVLAAIGVAIFFFVHSTRGQGLLQAGLERVKGSPSHLSSAPAQAASAPSPGSSSDTTSASTATASTAADASSATPPSVDQQNAATAAEPPAAASAPEDTSARLLSSDPNVRYVPANVMEGYLLSAPRPEYPAQARMDHIEGQVALQAIISRSGAVRALHVVKGPASLRSAAVAAVRTWRYRPYSANGQPEDVATTVYVDFTLKPPPTLVH